VTTTQLILLYLAGWIPMFYLGARWNNRIWKRAYRDANAAAYSRGWKAGFGYLQRISDARTERDSSVTIHADQV
jgi:hypothetical protein